MEQKTHRYRWLFITCTLLVFAGIVFLKFTPNKTISTRWLTDSQPGSYQVHDFRDGDTVTVDMGGTIETVRFIGVDTPETHKENTPVQCYGSEASAYTRQRIGQGKIRLKADRLTTNRDRYDRLLRYVMVDGSTDLGYELVSKGYAFAYAFPFANSQKYARAMKDAQVAKRGLWGVCAATQDPVTGQWHSPPISGQ
ncbi:MAG: micrococcal nuclease [Patescibacteria group bacterium]|nr:thermonuclease family protein [Candidatus Saccharibacteria bacterium]MDQ5963091.1 micrococcal nuclease [Patescibacteria group bacterium]